MGIFNNQKDKLDIQRVEDLEGRMEAIESSLKQLITRFAEMERSEEKIGKQLYDIQQEISLLRQDQLRGSVDRGGEGHMEVPPLKSDDGKTCQTFYLGAPNNDGVFTVCDKQPQIGTSLYRLQTEDGLNGQFFFLDTDDAVSTAMLSISQFVKPACRIDGHSRSVPNAVRTVSPGTATYINGNWTVRVKALVSFT